MKVVLFASDWVGAEIARFFGEINEIPICLVLDIHDRGNFNKKIIEFLGIDEEKILYYNALEKEETYKQLKQIELDLGILAWWPYIIKKDLISIPHRGFINFHPSYLPYNRGKDPNFWSLATGTPFGATIHYVDEGIDSGDIITQTIIEYDWEDTGKSLYEKAKTEIVNLFRANYHYIKSREIRKIPQPKDRRSIHYRKDIDKASQICLDKKYYARELLNLIRARTFPPHPGAWFIDDGKKYEVRVEIRRIE